jgi:type II secretory ATPase GspE/PulE/Tfp pilus assembly ATPase PilB-like protein
VDLAGLVTGSLPAYLYQAQGCPDCYHSGFKGRKSIYEILPVSQALRRMILQSHSDDAIKEAAVEEGMAVLRDSAIGEVFNGVTTLEEISRMVEMTKN